LVAYQGVNRTLIASPTYTYSIVITGGVVAATSITTQPASLGTFAALLEQAKRKG
jgi:hypothetical protein